MGFRVWGLGFRSGIWGLVPRVRGLLAWGHSVSYDRDLRDWQTLTQVWGRLSVGFRTDQLLFLHVCRGLRFSHESLKRLRPLALNPRVYALNPEYLLKGPWPYNPKNFRVTQQTLK